MSKQIILITGGARSGKSRYAEARAATLGTRRLYVATAEAKDEEMARRIAAHKSQRSNAWHTVEEPLKLTEALLSRNDQVDCALVDCLTLWLSNLLLAGAVSAVEQKVGEFVEILPHLNFHVILVTNEVGWGIVPENPLAREFRDLAGWANQQFAAAAHEVVLTVAGVPLIVKKDPA
jgi:adenosylcobinamide kinase / adenosylcobinamide-phosphate guanylyltransferase